MTIVTFLPRTSSAGYQHNHSMSHFILQLSVTATAGPQYRFHGSPGLQRDWSPLSTNAVTAVLVYLQSCSAVMVSHQSMQGLTQSTGSTRLHFTSKIASKPFWRHQPALKHSRRTHVYPQLSNQRLLPALSAEPDCSSPGRFTLDPWLEAAGATTNLVQQ